MNMGVTRRERNIPKQKTRGGRAIEQEPHEAEHPKIYRGSTEDEEMETCLHCRMNDTKKWKLQLRVGDPGVPENWNNFTCIRVKENVDMHISFPVAKR